jgi:predicted GIY-YIG superfamily endonuclease
MYYVYLIKNENNKLYVGCTNILHKRLKEHQEGKIFSKKILIL